MRVNISYSSDIFANREWSFWLSETSSPNLNRATEEANRARKPTGQKAAVANVDSRLPTKRFGIIQ